jgi:hypothetical protein
VVGNLIFRENTGFPVFGPLRGDATFLGVPPVVALAPGKSRLATVGRAERGPKPAGDFYQ